MLENGKGNYVIIAFMRFETIFFDLDGTLYPNETGMWMAIKERISQYLIEKLGFTNEQQAQLRDHYFRVYGTTLRGLQIHHQVNTDDFLAYVHDVPLDKYLKGDKELAIFLDSLPQNKWIFTNSDEAHATRVLTALGLEDCFDGIIDIRCLDFYCKPLDDAYKKALVYAGNPDPDKCILIDDLPRNLAPARQMGIFTVLAQDQGNIPDASIAHRRVKGLTDLRIAMPELWQD